MSGMNYRFQRSLLLAQACLAGTTLTNDDPLGLNLPLLFNPGGGLLPGVQALQTLAALYLHAELEQTGLVLLAEAFALERTSLRLYGQEAAAKLERFSQQQRDWYNRAQRLQLFARLFGLGGTAVSTSTQDINHTFQHQFAHLCHAINQVAEDYRWGQTPGPTREAALRLAARALLLNLGNRQFGNTLLAGRKIQAQAQAAINILNDPAIGGLVQARGLWDTLRKFYGDQTPDLGRLLNRGQSGQRLLTWLALALPELQRDPPSHALLPAGSPAFVWAVTWLEATGIPDPQRG